MKITLEGSWQEIRNQIKEILREAAPQVAVTNSSQGGSITEDIAPVNAPVMGSTNGSAPVVAPSPVNPITPYTNSVSVQAPIITAPLAGVPTNQPSYSLDDLSKAAMPLADSGRLDDLRNLLTSFGVSSLPDLPKEQYGAFAMALRNMGARI